MMHIPPLSSIRALLARRHEERVHQRVIDDQQKEAAFIHGLDDENLLADFVHWVETGQEAQADERADIQTRVWLMAQEIGRRGLMASLASPAPSVTTTAPAATPPVPTVAVRSVLSREQILEAEIAALQAERQSAKQCAAAPVTVSWAERQAQIRAEAEADMKRWLTPQKPGGRQ